MGFIMQKQEGNLCYFHCEAIWQGTSTVQIHEYNLQLEPPAIANISRLLVSINCPL